MNNFKLTNKCVFIVGGAGLIGAEISNLAFEADANVTILDIDKKNASKIINKNSKIKYEYFDCSDPKNLENNLKKIIKKIGCPDVFINCSYPTDKNWSKTSFKKITKKILDQNILIHLNSYSWIAKLVADEMQKNHKFGSIIQFSSIYGILGQDLSIYEKTNMTENMVYSIIKGGINNLTRQMASYYGKYNIRINTISPGGLTGHTKGKKSNQDKIFTKNYSAKVPLGRLGMPEEIAYCAIFLGSNASSYITGSNLVVDGGWSII